MHGALQTGALGRLGLEESRRAGWRTQGWTSVQPRPTQSDSSGGTSSWDATQAVKPLRACFLIGQPGCDDEVHSQHSELGTQEVPHPVLQTLHTRHWPPPGPCPSLVLQAPSHPRTPPRACLVPFNPCRAARGVPISASSRPGQELHLHRGPLLTDGHHSLSPAARHAHSGCHPCGCPLHPRTRLPSCSGAGPPGSRPGQAPSIFCGAAPRTESFPPLTRAARKQLFLPRWKVLSWPGRAG